MPYSLLLILPVVTGVYAHFTYGPWSGPWGFSAGAAAAAMILLICKVADRRRSGL